MVSQNLSSENKNEQKEDQAIFFPRTNLNPRRYVWIILGYYLFTMFLKARAAENKNLTYTNLLNGEGFGGFDITTTNSLVAETTPEGHHEGIQIFKVDWPNIEGIAVITLWVFCASLAKIAFHVTPKLGHIFPESCLLIVVGILIGVVMFTTKAMGDEEDANMLPTKPFFFVLLPPIILDAGYFMPSRLFFGNLGTILLFAVIGTVWNAFTIGLSLWGLSRFDFFGIEIGLLELLLFSTLISAVDPVAVLAVFEEIHVNDILYIVVFGESLLNDAVTVVLYHMFEEYAEMGEDHVTTKEILKGVASFPVVALGGTLIGIIWGFLTGFTTKFTNHVLIIEPIFVFVMAYMSYLNAELFHMSGVLGITFCGITMKKYVEANISPNSSITVKYALRMLSSSSETIIFMFLGVSTVTDTHVWNTWFVVSTIVFCTIFRFLGVLWMTFLANRFRLNKLNMVDQFVMSYGGLRGAVSFALVLLIEEKAVKEQSIRRMFVTTTIAVVFFTVFIQGITIKPFVEWLNVKRAGAERELTMNERLHERMMDHTLSFVEIILGTTGQNILRDKVKQIDDTYIRPYLIRDYKGMAYAKIFETYSKLEMKDAMEEMKKRRTPVPAGEEKVIEELPSETIIDMEDPRKISKASSGVSRRISSQRHVSDPRKISQLSNTPVELLSNSELFKPTRKQRKISYSRHNLEPSDLESENYLKYVAPIVEGRPRRKLGANLGMPPAPGEVYENQAFTPEDRWGGGGISNPASRRVSAQETPMSSAPTSPRLLSPTRPGLDKHRRFSSQTVDRPPTSSEANEGGRAGTPIHNSTTHFDFPRSPPPFAETILEEGSE